jgi:hypothetical protein
MNGPRRNLLALVLLPVTLFGLEAGLNGQASAWLGFSRDSANRGTAGLRYIPRFSMLLPGNLDAELSVNGSVALDGRTIARPEVEARLKPYRATLRFSTPRFEARAGLQKINFGSATLLRPLMWFDRIDPRDPLALTDGVYGLLGRYYFQNNANLWAWGLIGNSSPKGWEQLGSDRWKPELGGRAQIPFPRGEVAATYHHRTIDYSHVQKIPELMDEQPEDRLGLDAKVDVGVGLWGEVALVRERHIVAFRDEPPIWTRSAILGADYTFGLGNGLGVLAEHMVLDKLRETYGTKWRAQISALMLSLPLGLLDNLRGMVHYDWKNEDPYSFLGWQRTLDRWLFSVAVFWNPDRPQAAIGGSSAGAAAGKGVQVMVVYNH